MKFSPKEELSTRKLNGNATRLFLKDGGRGRNGNPFVDAHMREFNQTGCMPNRGRINCTSFLTRDYQIV
jgi:deoxyribodipyrimidine photo-lyase